MPRRIVTIIKGESLVNDATALVLLSFSVAAATTEVPPPLAVTKFAAVIAGEVAYGVILGWIALRARHIAKDPGAEILLSLSTTFHTFSRRTWSAVRE